MSTPNETPVEQAPAQPEAEKPQMMTPKSRNALLRYMTILFAVAFLVVTVSLVISMRASQNTITALNQTSASALQNAEQLQDSNRDLSDENAKLRDRVAELEDQLASAKADAETAASAQERPMNCCCKQWMPKAMVIPQPAAPHWRSWSRCSPICRTAPRRFTPSWLLKRRNRRC